jgi:hypothetical protein
MLDVHQHLVAVTQSSRRYADKKRRPLPVSHIDQDRANPLNSRRSAIPVMQRYQSVWQALFFLDRIDRL